MHLITKTEKSYFLTHNGTVREESAGVQPMLSCSLRSGNANLPFPNTGRCKKAHLEMTTAAEVVQTFQTFCAHLYQTRTDVCTFGSLAECSALSSPVWPFAFILQA